jgi:hypothetical protein
MPSMQCVQSAITSVPGIVSVQYREEDLGPVHAGSGNAVHEVQHVFDYRGAESSHVGASLRILGQYDGTIEFYHSLMQVHAPPQEDVDATRPVMLEIEDKLESQCGVALSSRVRESCRAVQCVPDNAPSQP